MKNCEIIQFEMRHVHPRLVIIKSFFGYFFVESHGAQVPNPKTGEITPSQDNELWDTLPTEKSVSPFLKQKVAQVIERFLAHYAVQKEVAA